MGAADPLAAERAAIDAIDAEIVALIARRAAVIERVKRIKRREGLPALVPARVDAVLAHVLRRAEETGVPPALVEALWRTMIDHFVAAETAFLSAGGPQDDSRTPA